MKPAVKISTGELVLFFWCAHFSTLALDAGYTLFETPQELVWRAVFGGLLSLAVGALLLVALKPGGGELPLPKVTGLFLAFAALAAFFQTAGELLDFLQTAVFSEAGLPALYWPLLAAVVGAASYRLEGNVRFGMISFWICFLGMVLLTCGLFSVVQYLPLTPLPSPKTLASASLTQSLRSTEWFLLYLLLPAARAYRPRTGGWLLAGLLAADLVFAALLFYTCGRFANALVYPWYQLASALSSISIQRMGDLYMLVWTLASFIKLCGFLLLFAHSARILFPKLTHLGAVLLPLPLFLLGFFWPLVFEGSAKILQSGILQLVGWVLWPLWILLKRRRKPHETPGRTDLESA